MPRPRTPPSPFRYFNSSPEVIRLVVMMYVRFPLSLRNVEDLLFERGIDLCHETVRHWWNRFGPMRSRKLVLKSNQADPNSRRRGHFGSASKGTALHFRSLHLEDLIMRNAMDFSPYRRSTVGFDRLFDFLERQAQSEPVDTYPPFDLQKVSDDRYRISLAVAGFRQEEIDITAHQNLLTIAGRKEQGRNQDGSYLHVGIAARPFERRFELADFMRVETAELRDGLLSIELVREIPEAMKPRTIAINGSQETVETGKGAHDRQPDRERLTQDA